MDDNLGYIVCLSTDYGDISSTLVHSTLEQAENEAITLIRSGDEGPGTVSVEAFSTETGLTVDRWGFIIEVAECEEE